MRIALVFTRYRPPHFRGGLERYIHELGRQLESMGHDVTVVAYEESLDTHGGLKAIYIGAPKIPYLVTLVFALKSRGIWDDFDVVGLQYPHMGLSVPGEKLVCMPQTTSLGEARSSRIAGGGLKKWSVALSRATVGRALDAWVFRKASAFVTVSNHIADEIRETCNRSLPVEIIPNGVDTDYFRPAASKDGSQRPGLRILCVGRLTSRKNFSMAIRALGKCAGPHRLRIAGAGPDEAELKALGESIPDGRCEFLGRLTGDSLLAEYQQADIFLMPSIYEGLPLVMLEALSCGLPLLAAPFAGAKDVVEGCGWLLPEASDTALAALIDSIHANPEERTALSVAARRIAETKYSWKVVAANVATVFEGAVAGQSQPLKG